MTEQTEAAEVFNGHAYTYPDSFCECAAYVGGHEDWREHMAETLLTSDWLAAREAAARAEGAQAVVEAVEALLDEAEVGWTLPRDVTFSLRQVARSAARIARSGVES